MAYIIEKQTGGEWRDAHEYLTCNNLGRASAVLLTDAAWARQGGLSFTKIKERLRIREDCNGWSNRETWAAALHIDNSRQWHEDALGLTRHVLAMAMQNDHPKGPAISDNTPADEEARQRENWARATLGESLQGWLEGLRDLLFDAASTHVGGKRVSGDICRMVQDVGSFDRVEWREVARHLIGKVREIDAA